MLAGLNTTFSAAGCVRSRSNPASFQPATNASIGASAAAGDRARP